VRVKHWGTLQSMKHRLIASRLSVRDRAALRIQCAYRCHLAILETERLSKAYKIMRAREEEEERVAAEVKATHARLLLEAKVLMVQCATRAYLAVLRLRRRKEAAKRREALEWARRQLAAAQLLQRVYRGHRGRKWFINNYARLEVDREDRRFCVECVGAHRQLASRLCRVCRDRYCDACWLRFHAHGNKRLHTYKALETGGISNGNFNSPYGGYNNGFDLGAPTMQAGQSEWVEQWDSSAQATYYYNARTGEASWVTPEELENPYSQPTGYSNFLL
jgi:hypothetical protein